MHLNLEDALTGAFVVVMAMRSTNLDETNRGKAAARDGGLVWLRAIRPWALPTWFGVVFSIVIVSTTLPIAATETIDPNDDGSQYAWSENAGWLNAEPLGDGGPGVRIWQTRAEGWMWAENFGLDYEVTHDGAGNLAGFGWAENAGWVSFSCENTMSCATVDYGVIIDPATGEFSGFAWTENIGWISFSCVNTGSCATVDYQVQTEVPFAADVIFANGFESGGTTEWSATVP
jgi:hypothetical protein